MIFLKYYYIQLLSIILNIHTSFVLMYVIKQYQNTLLPFINYPLLINNICILLTIYLLYLSRSYITLTTVGYGDITATNVYERILAIIIMLFGGAYIGYAVARVANLVRQSY